ncbi:MAG: c-type cytochrome [Acidimicrobiales bacterium]
MLATYMFAADFRGIGLSVAALVFIGFCAVFIWNISRARPELGSEIELAANRKEYLPDEQLEGEKLDRSLSFALVLLTLLAITLPFYWIAEPGRQEGAAAAYNASFESRGEGSYLVGAQCVNCHSGGGVGGGASYVLQDADGQFISNASWSAPALNNVLLRYSEDEVRYVLNYGRPGSPMAAWGTAGGGPLTTQQVNNIIIYLRTLQVQSLDTVDIAAAGSDNAQDEESLAAQEEANALIEAVENEVARSLADGEFETVGEAVFNLGLNSGFGAGAYSCGRCHTSGWSLGLDVSPDVLDEGVAGCGGGNPSGIGYNLCGDSVKNRFPDDAWLRPDGTWYLEAELDSSKVTAPTQGNPVGYDGSFIEALDGSKVMLNASGAPVNDAGETYLVLGPAEGEGGDAQNGDLAECSFVAELWESASGGAAYSFDPADGVQLNENGDFIDPEPLTLAQAGEGAMVLENNRIVSGCDIIEMPPRTSIAHYNFIYNGATAGAGYGEGGLSPAGMMPGFGSTLTPEMIQAVVDYERGL